MDPLKQYGFPLLRRMAEDPLNNDQPVLDQLKELGLDGADAERLLELLREGGYIDFKEHRAMNEPRWLRVQNARLTSKGVDAADAEQ